MIQISSFIAKYYIQRVLSLRRQALDYADHHPLRELQKLAVRQSVDYIQQTMPDAVGVFTAREVLDIALSRVELAGAFLEFGVFKGGSIRYIARRRPERQIHGFDSFEGLPEGWHGLPKGTFAAGGKLPRVPRNVQLHRGLFDSTLPVWCERHPDAIALIHIDCDLYSSTRSVFLHLEKRIVPGTVIVFDEFFGYPGWQKHEVKAFDEFLARSGHQASYFAYSKAQVAAKIVRV